MSIDNGVHQLGVVVPGNAVVWVQNNLVKDSGGVLVPTGPQAANSFFAGPPSGAPAIPTFRAMVALDINGISGITLPNLNTPILFLGGLTSAFPSLQRVGAQAQFLLADGSDFASIQAKNITANGGIFGVTGAFTGNVKTGNTLEVQDAGSSTNELLLQYTGGAGFIRTQAGTFFIGAAGANVLFINTGGGAPVTDNAFVWGAPAQRWSTIYGVNGDFTGNVAVTGTVKGSTLAVSTQQKFLATGAGTYTTPPNCRQIKVRMQAGGGGGTGSAAGGVADGTNGGDTIFNAVVAAGGDSGKAGGRPGQGGALGAGTANLRVPGVSGNIPAIGFSGATYLYVSPSGGGLGGGVGNSTGNGSSARVNSGGGGAGAAFMGNTAITSVQNVTPGWAGGSGEYAELIINAPAASYAFTVGIGGPGSAAGPSGNAGGNGGSGYIVVDEYY